MVNGKRILGLAGKGLAVVLAVLVVTAAVLGGLVAGGVLTVGRPTVESVQTSWGTVTDAETELEAEVTVNNPNFFGVPEFLAVEYAANMNDVTVAEDEVDDIGLEKGESEIDISAEIDNDEIVDWWVTHINNGERTDVSVDATVKGPLGVSQEMTVMQETMQTDMLSKLEGSQRQSFSIRGQQVAVTTEASVQWGEATDERTPLVVSVTVENTADEPVTVRDFRYFVGFNGVVMGEGVDRSSYTVQPGQTRTLTFELVLATQQVDDWWTTHVQNNETTRVRTDAQMTVEAYGEVRVYDVEALSANSVINTGFVAGDED